MGVFYTESEIKRLLRIPKLLPPDFETRLRFSQRRRHSEKQKHVEVEAETGERLRLIVRRNPHWRADFSVILGVYPEGSSRLFRLRRYNGGSHVHSNPLEENSFRAFHVHTATERYQQYPRGQEDTYAEATDRFHDLPTALECAFEECAFVRPDDPQLDLAAGADGLEQ